MGLAWRGALALGLEHKDIIRLLELALSWPVAATAITAIVVARFQDPISGFIGRLREAQFSGGRLSADGQQAASEENEQAERTFPDEGTSDDTAWIDLYRSMAVESGQQLDEQREKLAFAEYELEDAKNEIDNLQGQLEETKRASGRFEYLYLNSYLVPKTKSVLKWICESHVPLSKATMQSLWPPSWGDVNEQNAVLNALRENGLIEGPDEAITATPKAMFLTRLWFPPAS